MNIMGIKYVVGLLLIFVLLSIGLISMMIIMQQQQDVNGIITYLLMPLCIIAIFIWFTVYTFNLKKQETISNKESGTIIKLAIIFIVFQFFITFQRYFNQTVITQLFSLPLAFVNSLIPVYIVALLIYRNMSPFSGVTQSGSAISIEDSVKKIFNSNDFYSALTTVLPKGAYSFSNLPGIPIYTCH